MSFTDIITKSNRNLITLVDIYPKYVFTNWDAMGSGVYVADLRVQLDNIFFDLDSVAWNGVALTSRASIAALSGAAEGYYYDAPSGISGSLLWDAGATEEGFIWNTSDKSLVWGNIGQLYIKLTGSVVPDSTTNIVVATLRVGFSNYAVTSFSKYYHPIIISTGGFTISKKDFFKGGSSWQAGTLTVANPKQDFFKLSKIVRWKNAEIDIKLGDTSLIEADFKEVYMGVVDFPSVQPENVSFSCSDLRASFDQQFPLNTIKIADYPNLVSCDGQYKPIMYGVITKAPMYIVDNATPGVPFGTLLAYDSANCTVAMPTKIYKVLVGVTTTYNVPDVAKFDFTDWVANGVVYLIDDASGIATNWQTSLWYCDVACVIQTAPDIIKDIHTRFLGFVSGAIDTTSFNLVEAEFPDVLTVYYPSEGNALISGKDLLNNLEMSCNASIIYSGDGTVYLYRDTAQVDVNIFDVYEYEYENFTTVADDTNIRKRIILSYPIKDVSTWTSTNKGINTIDATNIAAIYTQAAKEDETITIYQTVTADIADLLTIYKALSSIPITTIKFRTPNLAIYNTLPSQKIKVTRVQAPNISGEYDREVLTIKSVQYNFLDGITEIEAIDTLDALGQDACSLCYACQNCYYAQGSCLICNLCQSCDVCQSCDGIQAGCVVCNACQNCNACQTCNVNQVGCSVCNVCENCNVAQAGCITCVICVRCFSCQHCYLYESGCMTCYFCELCNTCQYCVYTNY